MIVIIKINCLNEGDFYNRSINLQTVLNMQKQQEIQKSKKHKQRLLKKYLPSNQNIKFNNTSQASGFFVKDNDQIQDNSSISNDNSESQSSYQNNNSKKIKRVASSDEQNNASQGLVKKIIQNNKQKNKQQTQDSNIFNNKKLRKKFKKIFGIQNDQQLQSFLREMKIQGMDVKQIKKLLKSKKVQISLQTNQQKQKDKKEKKKKKKQQKKKRKQQKIKNQSNIKFQSILHSSESSDIEVPDQARTIYRNKDGTIKIQTEKEKKEKKKKQIQERLAEWEKGMKKQDSDKQDNQDLSFAKNQIWDDPLKLWSQENFIKPFECKYQGPGNRFSIKPGYRWDGVIRGNGFENKLIQEENLRKANQARQHKQYLKNL